MLISAYLFCGLLFCFYTFQKIFQNKENFITLFENEFGDEADLNIFLSLMFLTNLIAWPIMLLNELNSKRDL